MVYQMVIYFMIRKSKDGALQCNWRDYLYISDIMLQLRPEKVFFSYKNEKDELGFEDLPWKKSKVRITFSKFVKRFVKI